MSKLTYEEIKSKPPEFLALTSLTVDEFVILVPHFEKAFQAHMAQWCLDGSRRTKRSYATYQNCPLATAEDRLLFALSYLKGNPLQSVHGTMFGMAQCKVNTWLHVLLPVLRTTFRELGLAPCRSVSELAERFEITLRFEGGVSPDGEAPLPLFAMMARNGGLNVRKTLRNRQPVIAASNRLTP
jgi:Helix-turn-helix of DDE superfamily endonuclease